MMFGKLSLQYKVLVGLLADAFPSIFGGHFSFLNYPENWPNSQWLPHPEDLSTNGGEGWRRKWIERACLTSWNFWSRLPLWACAELFFLNLQTPLSLPIPGQLWLCPCRQPDDPVWAQASSILKDLEVVNRAATSQKCKGLLLVHLAKLD